MITRGFGGALVGTMVLGALIFVHAPAHAECVAGTETVAVEDGGNNFTAKATMCVPAGTRRSGGTGDGYTYAFKKICEKDGQIGCESWVTCKGDDGREGRMYRVTATRDGAVIDLGIRCYYDSEEITADLVFKAFKEVNLPASRLTVQPPGGRTLINFDTVFFTEAEETETTVRILDTAVHLRITPSNFQWNHGDGTGQDTTFPGKVYSPDASGAKPSEREGYVTHRYTATGDYQVSLDTTWSAVYRVGSDTAWLPVNGTVTIEGEAVPLEVVEARVNLVG